MIEIKNVSFGYGEAAEAAMSLNNISLNIKSGEFVVLCGKSGCGKTTLTRLINGLIPHYYDGRFSGSVHIDGKDIHLQPLAKTARQVGSVFQNPRSQFFNVDTTSELAFGCENLALDREEILARIERAADTFALDGLLNRSIFELSGGEKQRIACASVHAVDPEIFVLDEPSSNLDAASINKLRETLGVLKKSGKTIVISEHRLYYLAGLADRFLYLENGTVSREYNAAEMLSMSSDHLKEMGLRGLRLEESHRDCAAPQIKTNETLSVHALQCRYDKRLVLDIPELELRGGEIIAVIGHNGAGKSTFAGCVCGNIKCKGSLSLRGVSLSAKTRLKSSYMVMQDVNHQLFTESVTEELTLGLPDERKESVGRTLEALCLSKYAETHPLALSGGEKQRVAIGSAVCAGKEILIYDEPTSGQDLLNMQATCKLLQRAAESALLSLVITHDFEFIVKCCTSVLHMSDGKVRDYYRLDDRGMEKLKTVFLDIEEKSISKERMNAL